MAQIAIKLAAASDKDSIVEFIRQHWKEDHIFVSDRSVFDWQYCGEDSSCNFVIAERIDDQGSEILGVLGFIPFGRFDPKLSMNDISLALWKVQETGVPPGLGLRLLKFIETNLKPRRIAAIGISDYVEPMYKVLGYTVSRLEQGAIFNPDYQHDLVVSKNVPLEAFTTKIDSPDFVLKKIDFEDFKSLAAQIELLTASQLPEKSNDYLQARFYDHPWYKYDIFGVFHERNLKSLFVVRKLNVIGRNILRIVDFIGPIASIGHVNEDLIELLKKHESEYIDIMTYGSFDEDMDRAGLVKCSNEFPMVLPNYFSPFVQENINVKLAFKSFESSDNADLPVILNRADSDQDRPNSKKELEEL